MQEKDHRIKFPEVDVDETLEKIIVWESLARFWGSGMPL
jgi:hypothetical protein